MTRFGDFELIAQIGDGAASRVWSALHRATNTKVAIKFFNQRADKKTTDHLFREIRLVARSSHPRIVRVFGYGESAEPTHLPDGGEIPEKQIYLVMELVEKGTLKSIVGQTGWSETRQILLDVLSGLARVHARGIVHLDLKPVNVLMAERGAVLSDFGIALSPKQLSVGKGGLKKAPGLKLAIVGTPHFMAPEQCTSMSSLYGPWTDLYAIGCIAHSLITGRPPYREKEIVDVLIAHRTKSIPTLEDHYRVPVGFDDWLAKLLAKRWQERYLWAQDARADLLRLGTPSGMGTSYPSMASWSEPTMLSHDQVSDDTMLDMVVLRSEVPTGVIPLVAEQPEVVAEWSEDLLELVGPAPLEGVGLELIQFETAHIVGRLEERRALWRHFAFSARKNRLSTTILRGRPGTGKSVLAEWLCSTTHEKGFAHFLQIKHARDARSQDGILTALRLYFGLREETNILSTVSERLGLPEDDLLCQALVTHLSDAETSGYYSKAVMSHQERDHLLCRLLMHLAELRSLIVHLDDAQWGFNSLRLIHTLLKLNPRIRIHLLITVNDDELVADSIAANALTSLDDFRNVKTVELGPMSQDDCTSFVESRANLSRDDVVELVRLSKGNPLFVREFLLSRLSGEIRRDESGMTSMKKLWRLRIEQWLPDAPADSAYVIQCAAVLGSRVKPSEWSTLAKSGLARAFSSILSSGVESGFLNLEQDGDFTFVHGLFRNAVIELAKEQGNYVPLNLKAGQMIERLESKDHVRVATYFQHGGDMEAASRHWGLAVENYRQLDDYSLLRWALSQWTVVMRQRQVHLDHPEWWKLVSDWAFTDQQQGQVTKALNRLMRLKQRIERSAKDDKILVTVMLDIANCKQRLFGPGSAQTELNETLSLAKQLAPDLYVEVLVTIAKDLKLTGKYDESEALYREALSRLGEDENQIRLRAGSHVRIGDCLSRRERYEEALIEVKKGVTLARKSRSPHLLGDVLNLYGEVLRTSGYLELAEAAYREASELLISIGSVTRFFVQANLSIVLQLRGNFAQSRRILEGLLRQRRGHSFPRERMAFSALLLTCLVVDGDFRRFDHTLAELEGSYRLDWAEFDIGQAAYRAATQLHNLGQHERAIRTYRIVIDQYEKLGLSEPLAQVQSIVEELEHQEAQID
jgi:eukaryotic-like serine/threonine-protein kinase